MASQNGQTTGESPRDLDANSTAPVDAEEDVPKKPSRLKVIWAKTGLNLGLILMMAKGALAPVIAVSIYQSTPVANLFGNLGYLVAIISVISFAIMPRAKFLQTMILNLIGTSIGAAVSLLAIYCVVKARLHSTPPKPAPAAGAGGGAARSLLSTMYNPSASAVSALWLFFLVYLVNTIKAKFPALQFPGILFSIFVAVSMTYAPLFPNMAAGVSFMKTLLTAFTTAFALATGVSLFVFPISCRTILFKEMTGYFGLLRGTLKAQKAYMQSLEQGDSFSGLVVDDSEEVDTKEHHHHKGKTKGRDESPETTALKASIKALTELHSKIRGDLSFAKREVAWGKLRGNDLEELFKLFRHILLPMIGMGTVTDIFGRIAERKGWVSASDDNYKNDEVTSNEKLDAKKEWNQIMQTMRVPFETIMKAMDEGLCHASIVLELAPKEKTKVKSPLGKGSKTSAHNEDPEATAVPKPGDPGFAAWMDGKAQDFADRRALAIKEWWLQRDASRKAADAPEGVTPRSSSDHEQDLHRLWLILYVEHLLYCTAEGIVNLVHFADKKITDGTLQKSRLIAPGAERLKKWVWNTFKDEDTSLDSQNIDNMETGAQIVDLGDSERRNYDPEHLPADSTWQRLGNLIRLIPHFLGSPESSYGFRVACAVMTVGITAFLHDTQIFFFKQRIIWAMIIISIGMTMTAGSSIFGFIGRVLGSLFAMIFSIANWYIVDGKTAGVIPFLYFCIFCEFYIILKYPRFIVVALLSIVTHVLIVGYELEVRKLGVKKATSSTGQPAYPIYLLAPYRLATVAAGSFVAFIWTIFPFPITDRSQLRKNLGASLFLLANFYSCIHTTIRLRLSGLEGDMESKNSPGRMLEKNSVKVFGKCLVLVASLKEHAAFTAFEPTIGGKFPKSDYDAIITEVEHIMNYIALVNYATKSLTTSGASEGSWIKDLAEILKSISITTNEITSMLSLLSNSVSNAQALPPHLKPPSAYNISQKLEAIDPDILSIKHITEPGYSAFTVMQVASTLIQDDLEKLLAHVRNLVGIVDFTFHIVSTQNASQSSDETLWKEVTKSSEKGKRE